jgi:uncharacterized protein YdcH (DUF465 family)
MNTNLNFLQHFKKILNIFKYSIINDNTMDTHFSSLAEFSNKIDQEKIDSIDQIAANMELKNEKTKQLKSNLDELRGITQLLSSTTEGGMRLCSPSGKVMHKYDINKYSGSTDYIDYVIVTDEFGKIIYLSDNFIRENNLYNYKEDNLKFCCVVEQKCQHNLDCQVINLNYFKDLSNVTINMIFDNYNSYDKYIWIIREHKNPHKRILMHEFLAIIDNYFTVIADSMFFNKMLID